MPNRMAINTTMPIGFNGQIARTSFAIIESHVMSSAAPVAAYGCACKLDSGVLKALASTDTAAAVYGFVVRPQVVQAATFPGPTMDDFVAPDAKQPQSVLIEGYMNAKVNAGTATKGGQVYIRIADGSSTKPIGGIEATAVENKVIALPGAMFMGAADEYGVAEIRYMPETAATVLSNTVSALSTAVETLETNVGANYSDEDSLDTRVTALENA